MACTIRLAAETAKIGQPEINLGLIPGYGGTQRLSRLVGAGRALELLLTGDQISAAEAYRIGLVNRVVPPADLIREAVALGALLATKAPLAARYIIDAVQTGLDLPLPAAQVVEATLFGLVSSTADMEKSRDIAILKTMGSSSASIRRIFVLQGLIIGLIGTCAGAFGGLILIYVLDRFQLIHVPIDVYQIAYVPFKLELIDGIVVIAAAILICFVATIYPSRQASRLDPAQALRYQ